MAELKLAPLTVLIGANAAGKSNALEAIRFLSWMAQGQKLSALQFEINQNNAAIRGQIRDVFNTKEKPFTMGCQMFEKPFGLEWDLRISLELRSGKELHISQESLSSNQDQLLYETTGPTKNQATDITVSYKKFKQGKWPLSVCSDQLPVFTQMSTYGKIKSDYKEAAQKIERITRLTEAKLKRILFLDPSPSAMRGYSFVTDSQLQGNGSNISAVLYNLINPKESPLLNQEGSQKQEILEFIKSLPEQDISDIEFIKTPREEVMVTLTETFGDQNRRMDAGILSDGTLRVLAIAAALLSAEENSIVIIEEIDNGVHPSRAKQLLNQINRIALLRRLQIVLSTHNPALMDALPDEVIPDVVFCYRDKVDGSSKLISLKDVPDYPELISQGSLGDLVTEGALSNFVKNYEGSDAKKVKALKWLESIK